MDWKAIEIWIPFCCGLRRAIDATFRLLTQLNFVFLDICLYGPGQRSASKEQKISPNWLEKFCSINLTSIFIASDFYMYFLFWEKYTNQCLKFHMDRDLFLFLQISIQN